jgi:hypothetical protein
LAWTRPHAVSPIEKVLGDGWLIKNCQRQVTKRSLDFCYLLQVVGLVAISHVGELSRAEIASDNGLK